MEIEPSTDITLCVPINYNSPAAVSRYRMGMLSSVKVEPAPLALGSMSEPSILPRSQYGTVTRFGGNLYDVQNSLNVWSSGLWISTATGST